MSSLVNMKKKVMFSCWKRFNQLPFLVFEIIYHGVVYKMYHFFELSNIAIYSLGHHQTVCYTERKSRLNAVKRTLAEMHKKAVPQSLSLGKTFTIFRHLNSCFEWKVNFKATTWHSDSSNSTQPCGIVKWQLLL